MMLLLPALVLVLTAGAATGSRRHHGAKQVLCARILPLQNVSIDQLAGDWVSLERASFRRGVAVVPRVSHSRACAVTSLSSNGSEVHVSTALHARPRGHVKQRVSSFRVQQEEEEGRWTLQTDGDRSSAERQGTHVLVLAADPATYMVLAHCQLETNSDEATPTSVTLYSRLLPDTPTSPSWHSRKHHKKTSRGQGRWGRRRGHKGRGKNTKTQKQGSDEEADDVTDSKEKRCRGRQCHHKTVPDQSDDVTDSEESESEPPGGLPCSKCHPDSEVSESDSGERGHGAGCEEDEGQVDSSDQGSSEEKPRAKGRGKYNKCVRKCARKQRRRGDERSCSSRCRHLGAARVPKWRPLQPEDYETDYAEETSGSEETTQGQNTSMEAADLAHGYQPDLEDSVEQRDVRVRREQKLDPEMEYLEASEAPSRLDEDPEDPNWDEVTPQNDPETQDQTQVHPEGDITYKSLTRTQIFSIREKVAKILGVKIFQPKMLKTNCFKALSAGKTYNNTTPMVEIATPISSQPSQLDETTLPTPVETTESLSSDVTLPEASSELSNEIY